MTVSMDQWVFDRAEGMLRRLVGSSLDLASAEAGVIDAGWPPFGDMRGPSVFTRVSLLRQHPGAPGRTVIVALGDAPPATPWDARALHVSVAVPAYLGAEWTRRAGRLLGYPIPTAIPLRLRIQPDGVQPFFGLERWAAAGELLEALKPDERLAIVSQRREGPLSSVDVSLFAIGGL